MFQVTDLPTEGQFIAVWQHNGQLWSNVVRVNTPHSPEYPSFPEYSTYNGDSDTFEEIDVTCVMWHPAYAVAHPEHAANASNISFFIQ